MIRWIRKLWRAHLRRYDIGLLWPCCKKLADNLDDARMAFLTHTAMDPAWRELSEAEIIAIVGALK